MKPALITLLLCLSLPLAGADKDKILLKDFKALLTLAENGDVRAQFFAGQCYQLGENTKQDFKEAVKWFALAAEQGNADAQYNLGEIYRDGQGVSINYEEAHKWANIASANGHDKAGNLRADIENSITPSQRAEAQRLAREWMERHKK